MTRLAPAALLALLPALARAASSSAEGLAEILVPIGVVGTVFGFAAVTIGIVAYARHRNGRLRHETIRLAIEKGQPLPPELLDPIRRSDPALRDLRRGLLLLALGLGACLYFGLSPEPDLHQQWAAGFIPGLMGLAYLATWAIGRRMPAEARTDAG
jgi:hypothetical protein